MLSVLQYGQDVPGPRRPLRSPRQSLVPWSRTTWIATASLVTAATIFLRIKHILDRGGLVVIATPHLLCDCVRPGLWRPSRSSQQSLSYRSRTTWTATALRSPRQSLKVRLRTPQTATSSSVTAVNHHCTWAEYFLHLADPVVIAALRLLGDWELPDRDSCSGRYDQ